MTDDDIARVYAKYRHRLWGTDFIDRDSFVLAVKELLRGDK